MVACAWNLRKWLVATTIFLFLQKVRYFFIKNHWFVLQYAKACNLTYCIRSNTRDNALFYTFTGAGSQSRGW
jgi:hypothetical protein